MSADVPASAPGFFAFVHHEDRLAFEELTERAVRERSPFSYEYRMVLHDGAIKHGYSVGRPSISPTGHFEFFGVVMDVTERHRNEEVLRAAQAELTHMARLTTMGEFAASIAHEMNQPLTRSSPTGTPPCVGSTTKRRFWKRCGMRSPGPCGLHPALRR